MKMYTYTLALMLLVSSCSKVSTTTDVYTQEERRLYRLGYLSACLDSGDKTDKRANQCAELAERDEKQVLTRIPRK